MGYYILGLQSNREEFLGKPTHGITEDIAAIFSLFSTDAHIGVNQDVIHSSKKEYVDDAVMADVMSPM